MLSIKTIPKYCSEKKNIKCYIVDNTIAELIINQKSDQ